MVEVLATKKSGPGVLQALAKKGRGQDDRLALLNEKQRKMLKRLGGSGKINPKTGLQEFDEGEGGEGGVGAGADASSSVGSDGVGGTDASGDSTSSSVSADGQALGAGEDTSGAKGFDSSQGTNEEQAAIGFGKDQGPGTTIGTNNIGFGPGVSFGAPSSVSSSVSTEGQAMAGPTSNKGADALGFADPTETLGKAEASMASQAAQALSPTTQTVTAGLLGMLGLSPFGPALGLAAQNATPSTTENKGGVTASQAGAAAGATLGMAAGPLGGLAGGVLGGLAGGTLGAHGISSEQAAAENAANASALGSQGNADFSLGIPAGDTAITTGSKALKPISGSDTPFSSSAGTVSSPFTGGLNTPGGTRLMADGGTMGDRIIQHLREERKVDNGALNERYGNTVIKSQDNGALNERLENRVVQDSVETQGPGYADGGSMEGDLRSLLAGKVRSVPGSAPGRSDSVPTSAAPGTFVMPADAVAAAGDGNNEAGAKRIAKDLGAPHTKAKPSGSAKAKTSSGEMLIDPGVVKKLGNGDMKKGQAMLTAFAKDKRAQMIMKLLGAKAPKMAGA